MECQPPGGLCEPEQGRNGQPDRADRQRVRLGHRQQSLPAVPRPGPGQCCRQRGERPGQRGDAGGRVWQQLRRQRGKAGPAAGAERH